MAGEDERAAARAGVAIRELREVGEFQQVYRLFDEIWHPEPANVPASVELMAGFAHSGNYVAGAFAEGVLVGASVGFLAAGGTLHSHVTGAIIGRGVGYALKLHQRAWARERGLERITWTFDPLVRRNARFNLVKLGARPEEYLTDFYGVMADAINEGDTSDRLLAVWPVAGATDAEDGRSGQAYPLVREGADGRPVVSGGGGPVLTVGTPRDVERLRREHPEAARAWRTAVRETLGAAMAAGARVAGFTERGEYVVIVNQLFHRCYGSL
ncbi:GNAT family N-acetyltransferase [Nonomuraea sp. NPDC004297]